jgi:hypothetical protein
VGRSRCCLRILAGDNRSEELVDAVAELRTASLSKPELERALKRVEALSARVQKAVDLPGGQSVAQVAERLEVSEPTIRKWLAEGLLERVEGHKPVEITQRSVIEVERVLAAFDEPPRVRAMLGALGEELEANPHTLLPADS